MQSAGKKNIHFGAGKKTIHFANDGGSTVHVACLDIEKGIRQSFGKMGYYTSYIRKESIQHYGK